MGAAELINLELEGKLFSYKGKNYVFENAKKLSNGCVMVITSTEVIRLLKEQSDEFLKEIVLLNPVVKTEWVPNKDEIEVVKRDSELSIQSPSIYEKINSSFDTLLNDIMGCNDVQLEVIERKAKVLTSIAQTSVNIENSKQNLIRLFNNKK